MIQRQQQGDQRCKLVLSDSANSHSAMLATQLNHLVHDQQLKYGSIIRLHEYMCNAVQSKRFAHAANIHASIHFLPRSTYVPLHIFIAQSLLPLVRFNSLQSDYHPELFRRWQLARDNWLTKPNAGSCEQCEQCWFFQPATTAAAITKCASACTSCWWVRRWRCTAHPTKQYIWHCILWHDVVRAR